MKLFAFYVGGKTHNSNIELHDMRFCIGDALEDCYDDLKRQWWGTPESLHLDCWGEVRSADGYDILLRPEAYEGEDRLFFVNLGGYQAGEFTELHKNIFVTAPSESKAKVKALKTILDWGQHHKDNMFEVENMVCLDSVAGEKGLHIHLEKTSSPTPFQFSCGYKPIGAQR